MRETFAERVRRLRGEREMTLSAVDRAAGLNAGTVQQFERLGREPRLGTLFRLARAFGLPIEKLVAGLRETEPATLHGKHGSAGQDS